MITCVIVLQVEKTRPVSESAVSGGSFDGSLVIVRDTSRSRIRFFSNVHFWERNCEGAVRRARMNEWSKESS